MCCSLQATVGVHGLAYKGWMGDFKMPMPCSCCEPWARRILPVLESEERGVPCYLRLKGTPIAKNSQYILRGNPDYVKR